VSRLAGYPAGLLSLVQSQSFGIAPKDLGDVIAPIVDLTSMYLLTAQRATANSGVLVNGNNNLITVPDGEVWRVHICSATVIAGVGVTGALALTVRADANIVAISEHLVFVASTTRFLPMVADPFWLKAGDQLNVFGSEIVGAPTVQVNGLVSKLRA
jgi:hypothetical protein